MAEPGFRRLAFLALAFGGCGWVVMSTIRGVFEGAVHPPATRPSASATRVLDDDGEAHVAQQVRAHVTAVECEMAATLVAAVSDIERVRQLTTLVLQRRKGRLALTALAAGRYAIVARDVPAAPRAAEALDYPAFLPDGTEVRIAIQVDTTADPEFARIGRNLEVATAAEVAARIEEFNLLPMETRRAAARRLVAAQAALDGHDRRREPPAALAELVDELVRARAALPHAHVELDADSFLAHPR